MDGLGKIKKSILDMINSEEYIWLEDYYSRKTIFDILKVSRSEDYHSNFIEWLLDDKGSHNLNDYGIRKLLETTCLIDSKFNEDSLISNELNVDKILSGSYKLDNIKIKREFFLEVEGKGGRFDIYISLQIQYHGEEKVDLYIILENKIFSKENEEQTKRYYDWAINNLIGKRIFIYLTPLSQEIFKENLKDGNHLSVSKYYIPMNYQYFMDGVIEHCLRKNLSDIARVYIDEYICCISKNLIEDETEKVKVNKIDEFVIMAIGKEQKKIVFKLWDDYSDLLIKVMDYKGSQAIDKDLLKAFYEGRLQILRKIFSVILLKDNIQNDVRKKIIKILVDNELTFKGKKYIKYAHGNSFGRLGHDLIATYANQTTEKFSEFKDRIRLEKWDSTWLYEIIIEKGVKPSKSENFFLKAGDEVIWKVDQVEFNIARYWVGDDIRHLAQLLQLEIE